MAENQIEVTLGVLSAVEQNSQITQRTVAKELGVALGLVNSYLKRCVKKGYVKVRLAPASRYAYYLTPTGLAEKSRLTAEYLSQSFSFFRNAKEQSNALLQTCVERGWSTIALAGASDLAEIVVLCAAESEISIVSIIDARLTQREFCGIPVVDEVALANADMILLTHLVNPQGHYDHLCSVFEPSRVMAPSILCVSTGKHHEAGK